MPLRTAVLSVALLCGSSASGSASSQVPPPAVVDSAWTHLARYAGPSPMRYITLEAVDSVKTTVRTEVTPSAAWRFHFRFRRPGIPAVDQPVQVLLDSIGHLAPLVLRVGEVLADDPIEGIPPCANDSTLCAPSLTREEAIGIARKNGISEGLGPWKVEFGWNRSRRRFMWILTNTLIDRGPCDRSGKVVFIDASTGEIIWGGAWSQEC